MSALAIIAISLGLVPPPAPCGPVPNDRQARRMRLETCALVHLGLPTFLNRDAVEDADDRAKFRIPGFSARPWIDDLRLMGLDGLMLVARGEDGIPLAEPGILGEVAATAAAGTEPFGISLVTSGDDEATAAEVKDLCERFGPFFEVRLTATGNGTPPSSPTPTCEDACVSAGAGADFVTAALGTPVAGRDDRWQGVERFLSIRPSRYWRLGEDDRVRSIAELEDAWFASVGQGEPLLIGIPADTQGRFRRGDVERMAAFRAHLATLFARDLVDVADVTASATRGDDATFGAGNLQDTDDATYWAADDGIARASIECSWASPVTIGVLELGEPLLLGRRCDAWTAEVRVDGAWREVARGTSIGPRRSVRFPAVRGDRLRIGLATPGCAPALDRLSAFTPLPAVRLAGGEPAFSTRTEVTLAADLDGCEIRHTLDGRDPLESGTVAPGAIPITKSCLLRAVAIDAAGRPGHPIAIEFTRLDDGTFLEPAHTPEPLADGLVIEHHDAVDASLDELAGRTPRTTSDIDDVRLPRDRPADRFALVFRGFLRVPADGLYTFSLRSDDGSRLYLHDRLVVDRDGPQIYENREGRIGLRRGLHPIRVEFCEFDGRESLALSWSTPGEPLARIPAAAYAR